MLLMALVLDRPVADEQAELAADAAAAGRGASRLGAPPRGGPVKTLSAGGSSKSREIAAHHGFAMRAMSTNSARLPMRSSNALLGFAVRLGTVRTNSNRSKILAEYSNFSLLSH